MKRREFATVNTETNNKYTKLQKEIENKAQITCVTSSGAGGQNVNRVKTKVQIKVDIDQLEIPEKEKEKILRNVRKNTITVTNQESRYQAVNKRKAYQKLFEVIKNALQTNEKARMYTKVPTYQKQVRRRDKSHQSQKKQGRRKKLYFD